MRKAAHQYLRTLISPSGEKAKLIILMYHRILPSDDPLLVDDVDVSTFDSQMSVISKYYNNLSLYEALNKLKTGTLPSGAVCITFDDGYADNYTQALPILKKWNLKATFFIATDYIENGIMWNDIVIESIRKAPQGELNLDFIGLKKYFIKTEGNRIKALSSVLGNLKYLSPEDRLHKVNKLSEYIGVELPNNLMMSKGQLRCLASEGMEIGAHTKSHPILSKISLDKAKDEIIQSREILHKILDKDIRTFAYPNGVPGIDYGKEHIELIKNAGFCLAVSTQWGHANKDSDIYQLPRIAPWDKTPLRFNLRILKTYID